MLERVALGHFSFWGMRMKIGDPFYKSAKWKRLRDAVLRRDGYMCQVSRRYGKRVQADTVHHIFPRDEFPEYQYAAWNLIALSGAAHNRMHDRVTNALTDEGVELLRRTARRRGMAVPLRYDQGDTMNDLRIMKSGPTLVCGLPGTGKSTWVREHMGDGVAYDLDAIAAAFRLRAPHEERHEASRWMANDLLYGFINNVHEYGVDVFVIRTAPKLDELRDINPRRVVVMTKRYVKRAYSPGMERRLRDIIEWCESAGVPVEMHDE